MASRNKDVLYLNFKNAIEHVPGFKGNRERDLKDIFNLDINNDGWLVPRPGMIERDPTVLFDSVGALDADTPSIKNAIRTRVPRGGFAQFAPTLYKDIGNHQAVIINRVRPANNPQGVQTDSRLYYLPKTATWASVRNNRLLLIADISENYFIDIDDNIRYDWNLDGPIPIRIDRSTESNAFFTFRARLLQQYQAGLSAFSTYPVATLDETTISAYRWTFENPDISIVSNARTVYMSIDKPQTAVITWLNEPNVKSNAGTVHATRALALLNDGLITSAEYDLISEEEDNVDEFFISNVLIPNWATHVGVYKAELPSSVYQVGTELFDGIGDVSPTTILTGTALIASGAITANPGLVATGVPIVIFGLITLSATHDSVTRIYDIDYESVDAIDDSEYIRLKLHRINNPTDIEISFGIPIEIDENDVVYLDARYNITPTGRLNHIVEHAGRIYGVDGESQDIIFSHIDGNGNSNYLAFPKQNRFPVSASGITPIIKLQQMPDKGGIYVFKRDAIHYIEGQNIFSGLYDISISAQTDISAAGYKENIGCLSPFSIVSDGTIVLFVGTDDHVYALQGSVATPIGLSIKPFIEALTIEQQSHIVCAWHNRRFYLTLFDSTLLLDTDKKWKLLATF